jgi:hypothetical protein
MITTKLSTFIFWALLSPCVYATGLGVPPPGYHATTEFCATISNSANAGINNTGTALSNSIGSVHLEGVTAPNHVAGGANPSMNLRSTSMSDGSAQTTGAGTASYTGRTQGEVNSTATKNMKGIGYTVQHGTVTTNTDISGHASGNQTVAGTVQSISALNAVSNLSLPKIGISDEKGALVQGDNSGGVISGNANATFIGTVGR